MVEIGLIGFFLRIQLLGSTIKNGCFFGLTEMFVYDGQIVVETGRCAVLCESPLQMRLSFVPHRVIDAPEGVLIDLFSNLRLFTGSF